jgi:PAS domain S-box-containing protein
MEYSDAGNRKALLEIVQQYVNTGDAPYETVSDDMDVAAGIHILGRKLQEAELSIKIAEQQLLRSGERYNNMVAAVEDYAILILDIDGNILNWNKGAEMIKGYAASEILGRNFRIFYAEKDRAERLPERLISTAVTEGRVQHDGWRVCKDGKTFWGTVTITALHDDAGNINGFLKITHDLTDKKLAEDQKRLYIEKLEQQNMELEQFTYIASHDLQEPLRSISSLAELLVEQYTGKLDEHADNYFKFILQSSNRMSQLIKSLLDYSRIGAKEKLPEKVDVNTIIETVKADLRKSIQDSNARITVKDLPVIVAYPMELTLLFQNLLSNAIKFKKADQSPRINISACKIDAGWLFSFCDNGIGLEDRFREKIFEIFQRLHSKQVYEGTGIGLAHCRKIVTMHNGKIWVESAPGKGSQFYFTISA